MIWSIKLWKYLHKFEKANTRLGGDWDTKRGEKLRADDMINKNIKICVLIWEKQILGRDWHTKRDEKLWADDMINKDIKICY